MQILILTLILISMLMLNIKSIINARYNVHTSTVQVSHPHLHLLIFLSTTQMANFELQTRVPLLIHAPWVAKGGSTRAIVELVDMVAIQISIKRYRYVILFKLYV